MSKDTSAGVLDRLVDAIDSVAGKLGHIETHLLRLEEATPGRPVQTTTHEHNLDPDEPVFTGMSQIAPRQKHRHLRQVMSDIDIVESDVDSKVRKKNTVNKSEHRRSMETGPPYSGHCGRVDATD